MAVVRVSMAAGSGVVEGDAVSGKLVVAIEELWGADVELTGTTVDGGIGGWAEAAVVMGAEDMEPGKSDTRLSRLELRRRL